MEKETAYKHELVVPNEDLPFKLFVFEGKEGNYVRDRHWHRSIEIFAVFEGSLTFILDEKKVPLKAGEFIIVNSNEVHSVFSPKPNLTIVLQIPMATFENYYSEERFVLFSHEPSVDDSQMMELIQNMYENYVKRACGYEFQVQSQFYMLMYLMITQYRINEVSEDMVKNHRKLNRLSSKMFQKYAKINYKAYLQSVRVEYAYQELVKTDKTISEIAAKHGFSNQKAFAKEFQKKYGMLPSEYRKNIR